MFRTSLTVKFSSFKDRHYNGLLGAVRDGLKMPDRDARPFVFSFLERQFRAAAKESERRSRNIYSSCSFGCALLAVFGVATMLSPAYMGAGILNVWAKHPVLGVFASAASGVCAVGAGMLAKAAEKAQNRSLLIDTQNIEDILLDVRAFSTLSDKTRKQIERTRFEIGLIPK